jgi:G:T/U-mismatch repair DNA glycosylase
MATQHLFKADLEHLEDNPLTDNYKILVVGTFNASISGNSAQWFYGRPENEFWCLFPRMLGFESMHPVDRNEDETELAELWRGFCKTNEIIIVDLFKEVKENLPNHADSNLQNLKKKNTIDLNLKKLLKIVNLIMWYLPGKAQTKIY